MSRVFDSSQNEDLTTPVSAVYSNLPAFTWSIWARPTASPDGNFSTILVKDPNVAYAPFIQFNGNGTTTLTAAVKGSTTFAFSVVSDLLSLNVWTNIIMTFNFNGDKLIHIYYGGVEVTYSEQIPVAGTLGDDSAGGFVFGGDTFPNDGWDGNLAEMALWNTVLTGPQITSVASSTTGVASIQAANLVGYWHLCGTASPEPDVTVNGNNATLSVPPPTQGVNSPGFNCGSAPVVLPWSSTDSRVTPNASRTVNQTKTYDVQTSSNPAVPGTDSRAAGAPVASGTYPQNSRTPGLYGPGEN